MIVKGEKKHSLETKMLKGHQQTPSCVFHQCFTTPLLLSSYSSSCVSARNASLLPPKYIRMRTRGPHRDTQKTDGAQNLTRTLSAGVKSETKMTKKYLETKTVFKEVRISCVYETHVIKFRMRNLIHSMKRKLYSFGYKIPKVI